jgi:hypothetical protein
VYGENLVVKEKSNQDSTHNAKCTLLKVQVVESINEYWKNSLLIFLQEKFKI